MYKYLNSVFTFLLCLFVAGCIGVVDSKNPEVATNASMSGEAISFGGLAKAVAISDTKVELYWYPALGNPSDITYFIHIDNSDAPYHVNAESLSISSNGQYSYTVKNLQINTTYSFRISVQNANTGAKSTNDRELIVTTFANRTADFGGISSLRLADGEAGSTSVIVEWAKAVTIGTTASRPTDPIQYEIRYIAASNGGPAELADAENPNIVFVWEPLSVTASSMPSAATSKMITGLVPGEKYFFMVRSVHANYLAHSDDLDYKREENNQYLSIATRDVDGIFDFDVSRFKVNNANGEAGLTSLDLTWEAATGNYNHYRVYYKKIGNADAPLMDVEALNDSLSSEAIDLLNLDSGNYRVIDAGTESMRVKNLESYAYYHLKVVACKTLVCSEDKRLISNLVLARVVPKKAPFNGIVTISNPTSVDTLDEIALNFEAPIMTYGYANALKVYCFENEASQEPVEIKSDAPSVSIIPSCNGLQLAAPMPTTVSGLSSINKATIKGIKFPSNSSVSNFQYCISIVPQIETPYLPADNDLGIIKCKIPEIEVPTNLEFTGKDPNCTQGDFNSLKITWKAPSSGIYTNYQVFWKKKDGMTFRFSDAVVGTDPTYSRADLSSADLEYSIAGLIPGNEYEIGVLTYLEVSGDRKYSQFNSSVSACRLSRPVANFTEWVDVFAVGGKIDGRIPVNDTEDSEYIIETLDRDYLPIEVAVDVNKMPTSEFTERFGSRSGSEIFSGTYGSYNADIGAVKNQYSNSGIVRLVWKDFYIAGSTQQYGELIQLFEPDGSVAKKERKYGYKILRSEDGRKSWVDLTSADYDFQSNNNSGLLLAEDYSEYTRNNAPPTTFKAISFIDYSVSNYRANSGAAKAKVYYYKIVPYFEGEPLIVDNLKQSVIKVVLPPPNMSLINRLAYNRASCLEIGKAPIIDNTFYYGCFYNGLGSRGLSVPWTTSQSMLDLGGDLLVDRFEMGCNYTRGDINNQNSNLTSDSYDFNGYADSGVKFKGCIQKQVNSSPILGDSWLTGVNTPAEGTPYSSYNQIIQGDCIGQDAMSLRNYSGALCPDESKVELVTYIYPGARGGQACNITVDALPSLYFSPYYKESTSDLSGSFENTVAQSEFGAVYYTRHNRSYLSTNAYSLSKFRAGGGNSGNQIRLQTQDAYRPGGCHINLPVVDNSGDPAVGAGRWKPRWFTVRSLESVRHMDGSTVIADKNLITSTVEQVINDSALYDADKNSLPMDISSNRYSLDTKIGRIISSNNSKLPPLNGMKANVANDICSTYQVAVGYDSADGSFWQTESAKNKRLMRRKEIIGASAWPKSYDSTVVTNIEKGTMLETAVTSGSANNSSCNSYDKGLGHVGGMAAGDSLRPEIAGNSSYPRLLTGSSYYDSTIVGNDTQKCQSRYGVQDLIGNTAEISSDVIKCNYTGDSIFIGGGAQENSVPAPNNSYYNYSTLTPWVLSDPDTGRCSTVEIGSSRNFQASVGAYISPTNLFGTINTDVVPVGKDFDLFSVDDVRSGDGYFLDFGQGNFAAPLSYNDTFALNFDNTVKSRSSRGATVDPRRSKYFNPVLGLPLECGQFGALSGCNQSPDNMSVSTDELVTLSGIDPTSVDIADFPTNNSQIISDGMSEIITRSSYSTPTDLDVNVTFMDSVNVAENEINTITENLQNVTDSKQIYNYSWRVQRESELYMSNGGRANTGYNGRYSLHLRDQNLYEDLDASGFRCAIKVSEDD